MKLAFVVFNAFLLPEVMRFLAAANIDYYTRWDDVKGKGHGTEPHLGKGSHVSTNCTLMIAFEEEAPLRRLLAYAGDFNSTVKRPDDRVRVFQVPLELII